MNFSNGIMMVASIIEGTVSYNDYLDASTSTSSGTYCMVHGGTTSTTSSDKYKVGAFCFSTIKSGSLTRGNAPLAYR